MYVIDIGHVQYILYSIYFIMSTRDREVEKSYPGTYPAGKSEGDVLIREYAEICTRIFHVTQ